MKPSKIKIIKEMITKGHYILCGLFVIFLTIVLYGLAKAVIKMSFGQANLEKNYDENVKNVSFGMYLPQIVLLSMAFILGVYVPKFLDLMINGTIAVLVG